MGPWHGEISSNVTFAYCTKGCIDVVVLRGRPLTHVRAHRCKTEIHLSRFFFLFSLRKLAERVHKGKKVRLFKDRHTQSTMGASIARKWTRLGHRVLLHQPAQVFAFSCIMTCFSCARWSFGTQSVLVHFLPKMGLRKSRSEADPDGGAGGARPHLAKKKKKGRRSSFARLHVARSRRMYEGSGCPYQRLPHVDSYSFRRLSVSCSDLRKPSGRNVVFFPSLHPLLDTIRVWPETDPEERSFCLDFCRGLDIQTSLCRTLKMSAPAPKLSLTKMCHLRGSTLKLLPEI